MVKNAKMDRSMARAYVAVDAQAFFGLASIRLLLRVHFSRFLSQAKALLKLSHDVIDCQSYGDNSCDNDVLSPG